MHLGVPFGSALAHADLGPAYIADGADALATMELKAARVAFERLGSESDTGQDDPTCWNRLPPESARYSHITGWGE